MTFRIDLSGSRLKFLISTVGSILSQCQKQTSALAHHWSITEMDRQYWVRALRLSLVLPQQAYRIHPCFSRTQVHSNFCLDILVWCPLKNSNLVRMCETHPKFWCSFLGQKGASFTRVDAVSSVCTDLDAAGTDSEYCASGHGEEEPEDAALQVPIARWRLYFRFRFRGCLLLPPRRLLRVAIQIGVAMRYVCE